MKFEPENLYSSIGKMQLSTKKTKPVYGFGTSNRVQSAKVFQSKELSKTQYLGKEANFCSDILR
jgi:hypothetical protein